MSTPQSSPNSKFNQTLSTAGNYASLLALLIVLIQTASSKYAIPEQFLTWRLIFALIMAVVCTGIILITTRYCIGTYNQYYVALRTKTIKICVCISLSLICVGICIDGFFSALYWSKWLQPIWNLVHWALS